ncbi:hypothetical protein ACTXPA_07100 [Glutamicibacter arilaitensis]|uniref:hypothetical protein n=1 Tax=Glutamicibacter arilaitensis TaxID=256701 RepID=UPI003FCF4D2E
MLEGAKKHCTSQSAFSSVAISAGIVFSLAFAGTFVPASATSVSESSAEAKLAPSAAETDPAATLDFRDAHQPGTFFG